MTKTTITCLTVLALVAASVPAELSAETLERSVIGSGGGTATGDGQTLGMTVGQALAGRTAGARTLHTGYWHPPLDEMTPIFLTSFTAAWETGGRVHVHWRINLAVDNPGVHVWRETADGARLRLTDEPLQGAGDFAYNDVSAPAGELAYWLESLSASGASSWHGPVVLASAPLVFELAPNHPNPFNPMTTLRFSVRKAGPVRLTIHDLRGRRVRTLIDEAQAAGWHAVNWNGTDDRGRQAPSGVYVSRLQTDEGVKTGKLQLTR